MSRNFTHRIRALCALRGGRPETVFKEMPLESCDLIHSVWMAH